MILDVAVLGYGGPWRRILQRVGLTNPASHITARERVWLANGSPEGKKVAVVLGTSRGMAGFSEPLIERETVGWDVVKLARPGHLAFQTRSLIEELVDAKPDVVVLPISEFDTHRPVRIEPVSGRATANMGAIVDLVRAGGPEFAWTNRSTLLRLLAASSFRTYRFRELLGLAGVHDLRRFPREGYDERAKGVGLLTGPDSIAFWDGEELPVSEERLEAIAREFQGPLAPTVRTLQIPMVREITAGTHAPIQSHLIRRGVERLQEAGIEVVIVETPLHPATRELYDSGLRAEFLELANGLDEMPGVTFLSLDEVGPFGAEDFGDVLHLGRSGQERISRAILPNLAADDGRTE